MGGIFRLFPTGTTIPMVTLQRGARNELPCSSWIALRSAIMSPQMLSTTRSKFVNLSAARGIAPSAWAIFRAVKGLSMKPRGPSVTAPSNAPSSSSPSTTGDVAESPRISNRHSETPRVIGVPSAKVNSTWRSGLSRSARQTFLGSTRVDRARVDEKPYVTSNPSTVSLPSVGHEHR